MNMIKDKKIQSISKLQAIIERQLSANFISLKDFIEMPKRKAIKIVKLLSKLDGYKVKKNEIKDLITFYSELATTKSLTKFTKAIKDIKTFVCEKFNIVITLPKTIVSFIGSLLNSFFYILKFSFMTILRN